VTAPVRLLSGGQRQAIAIARSLARESRILLLDEPTAALGVEQTQNVTHLIADLREAGKTVIVISHNLDHVFQVADRIAVLRLGRLAGVRARSETSREEIVGLITGAIPDDTALAALAAARAADEAEAATLASVAARSTQGQSPGASGTPPPMA